MPRLECSQCKRPRNYCYCHLLKDFDNPWPVHILQHCDERAHPLNTARIAQLCLHNCNTFSVTDKSHVDETTFTHSTVENPVLIYPSEHSKPVSELPTNTFNTLIFIDANWKKSNRIFLQSAWLQNLPAYALPPLIKPRYLIRKAPKPDYCSTVEAIVAVMETVEKKAGKYQQLLAIMDWIIQQQIKGMGQDTFKKNY